jgi:hypothetical protein
MNEPIDHHYLPIFYLSRWADENGRVVRFERTHSGIVKAKRVVPKGTAYEPKLYSVAGLPPEEAHSMEKEFMARLDDQAASALLLLEAGLSEDQWTSGPRSAWSRFVLAQMLRAPEDIAQLKSSVREALGQTGHAEDEEFALKVAMGLMDHPLAVQMINAMHWHVIEVPSSLTPLVTSDRPVWMTITLTEPDAYISMPIGPRRLFLAAKEQSTLKRLRPIEELVAGRNLLAIQHAVKYGYGIDDQALTIAREHLATKRHSSLLELMAVARGHQVMAAGSPVAGLASSPNHSI